MIELYSKLRTALTRSRENQPPVQSKDEESLLEIDFRFSLQFGERTTD